MLTDSNVNVPGASCSGLAAQKSPELEAPVTEDVPGASSSGPTEQDIVVAPDWRSLKIERGDNLPHWICDRAIYHVSFRLADAVPRKQQDAWRAERTDIVRTAEALERSLSEHERKRLQQLYSDKVEAFLDAGYGACHLRDARIENLIVAALQHFDGERYQLHAWCVMPNHVHVIVETITSKYTLPDIVHSWKSFTALQANRLLGRRGSFWMTESYDHIIRSADEYRTQIQYVWNNPNKAGLKSCPRMRSDVSGASCSGPAEQQSPELEAPATENVSGASCSGLATHSAPELEAPVTKDVAGASCSGATGEPHHA